MKGISPAKAARLTGLHYNTVYAACKAAVSGSPTHLKKVTQDPVTRYYRIDLDEVLQLRDLRSGGSIL